jgi:hypothetical protein
MEFSLRASTPAPATIKLMPSRRTALALPTLLVLLGGCGSVTSNTPTGRLEVVAVLGPTCPVVSNTDTECGDMEFSDGALVLINGTTEVPLVLDVHGRATITLSAGEWGAGWGSERDAPNMHACRCVRLGRRDHDGLSSVRLRDPLNAVVRAHRHSRTSIQALAWELQGSSPVPDVFRSCG